MQQILSPGVTCLISHVVDVVAIVFLGLGLKYLAEFRIKMKAFTEALEDNPPEAQ